MAIIHENVAGDTSPIASIIIVNFNQVNLLAACLQSVENQEFRDFEVIVVDNGSVDGSVEMVRRRWPEARVVENRENRGFCGANNQGFAAARGRYLVLLNNDAEAGRNWLGELVREAEAHPAAGMVGAKIYVYGTERTFDKAGHLLYWDGQNRGRGAGEEDRGQYDAPAEILWPDGCAALYRREMIEATGGFDEDFFAYADDAELGMRGRLLGWSARLAARAVVHHHRGATMGKYNLRRIYLIERNRWWLVMKHFPVGLIVLNPVFFALRFGATFWASLRGEGEAAHFGGIREKLELGRTLLEANLAAWAAFPTMWKKRREFRRKRKLGDGEVLRWLRQYGMTLRELARQRA